MDATEKEYPAEVISALTVAMSCPEFTEDDVEQLVEEVRPDILLAAAARIYQLSGMVEDAKGEAKKRSGRTRRSFSLSGWRWHWGKHSAN